MAIPNNYIDKITNKDTGESRIISPAADMVRVGNENFEGADLDEVLDEVAQAIEDAGGGYEPPQGGIPRQDLEQSVQDSLELADSSLQPSDKTQLQGAITQLQNALNTLIGSGNVQGAIDTFNEVTAFLNGIDTDDPTLANQLNSLNNAISALQTALEGKISGIKANGASETLPVVNGIVTLPPAGSTISPATAAPLEDGTAGVGSSDKYAREDHVHPHDTSKQDTLTFDDVPTAGHTTQVMSSDKIKTALDSVIPTISQDGNWVIGGQETNVKAQGPKGNSVADGDTFEIVNNVSDGGQTDALSAEMGKVIRNNIIAIYNALAPYAFTGGKPVLSWGANPMKWEIDTDGIVGLTVSNITVDGEAAQAIPQKIVDGKSLSFVLSIPSGNLDVVDDIVITMGGVPLNVAAGSGNSITYATGGGSAIVVIGNVSGDIAVTAGALSYVDADGSDNKLIFHLDCKNRGGVTSHWIDSIGNIDFLLGAGVSSFDTGVTFNGSTNAYGETNSPLSLDVDKVTVEAVCSGINSQFNPILVTPVQGKAGLAIFTASSTGNRVASIMMGASGVVDYDYSGDVGNDTTDFALSFNINSGYNKGVQLLIDQKRFFTTDSNTQTKVLLGARLRGSGNNFLDGTIKAIRIYNTKLLPAEQLRNWKVDKKRFNL